MTAVSVTMLSTLETISNVTLTGSSGSQVSVIDAKTKEVLAWSEMTDTDKPPFNHTSGVSPDGKYAYVVDGGSYGMGDPSGRLFKVDALTLEPVQLLEPGGTIHHMAAFGDKYMLFSFFGARPEVCQGAAPNIGAAAAIMDTETNEIVWGICSADLGEDANISTKVWAGPDEKYIYALVENPAGHSVGTQFIQGVMGLGGFDFWIDKIDAVTGEVVAEYPYPGITATWIQFSADGKYMYTNGSADNSLIKLDLGTGALEWRADVGPGPYGIAVIPGEDGVEKEIWVADKGESWKRGKGTTITVINAETGGWASTINYGGRHLDHVVLSPDGTEIWASSNSLQQVYVIDVATRETTHTIDLPGTGRDAHGVVFVYVDQDGTRRVVSDQGGFHDEVDPVRGRPLEYQ